MGFLDVERWMRGERGVWYGDERGWKRGVGE